MPQARAVHGVGARRVHLRRLRSGGRTAPPGLDGDGAGTPRSPAEALAEGMRLRPLPPAPHQLGSIGRVYYVFANSEQEVFAKNEQRAVEKYARTPDSVLFDKGLSIAARCVYGVLARHAFQGTTANIGQRRIANLLGVHVGTVNRSLHE